VNAFLDRLRDGEPVLMLAVRSSRTADVLRIARSTGHHAVMIDLEHSTMSLDIAATLCATAGDLGLFPFVRVPEREYGAIGRLLDGGAQGIIAPRVETPAQAATVARACRFAPRGQRSQLATVPQLGRVVMLPSPEPERAFAVMAAEGVTVTAAVPAVAQRWIRYAREHGAGQLRTLTLLQVGGARLADEIARQVRPVLGATLQQVFGMAEGLLNYTRPDDPDDVICTTQGRPLSEGDEVRIVDELDRDVPDGEPGSLLTRGPYTPRGYYRAAEQNTRAFTADGWYRSGDIVRRRADGNLIVEGRDKDMINRGGEKISAEEVENLLYQLPQVAHAAAVAMPDPELGERVCVYAVLAPGAALTLDAVRAAMTSVHVARYKWPEHLVVVPELPATKVGKIDKKALRADIAARLGRD
jgi:salicylate---CoA ligase